MNKIFFVIPALILFLIPVAYADVTIEAVQGSGAPGCEETVERCYTPYKATVSVGEKIIFSNPDYAAHTFTSGDPANPNTIQGLFDSSLVMTRSTFEWVPSQEGIVPYFCMVHPWMTGTIMVGSGGDDTDNDSIPPTPKDNPLEIENQQLRDQIMDLKLENRQLKNQVDSLNSEIDNLKDQIVSMTKEFVAALEQLTKWFGDQLNS